MRKKARVVWSDQAKADLAALHASIAKHSRITADKYVGRLKRSVGDLRFFPERGWVVPESGKKRLKEIGFNNQRIIYHYDGGPVTILTVHHAPRLLHPELLEKILYGHRNP